MLKLDTIRLIVFVIVCLLSLSMFSMNVSNFLMGLPDVVEAITVDKIT